MPKLLAECFLIPECLQCCPHSLSTSCKTIWRKFLLNFNYFYLFRGALSFWWRLNLLYTWLESYIFLLSPELGVLCNICANALLRKDKVSTSWREISKNVFCMLTHMVGARVEEGARINGIRRSKKNYFPLAYCQFLMLKSHCCGKQWPTDEGDGPSNSIQYLIVRIHFETLRILPNIRAGLTWKCLHLCVFPHLTQSHFARAPRASLKYWCAWENGWILWGDLFVFW